MVSSFQHLTQSNFFVLHAELIILSFGSNDTTTLGLQAKGEPLIVDKVDHKEMFGMD